MSDFLARRAAGRPDDASGAGPGKHWSTNNPPSRWDTMAGRLLARFGVAMQAPPLYYLVGPAGHPNYGDEIITAGWLKYLAETAPDATVWVDAHSPGPAQVLLGDLHPRVRFTDTLWRLCWAAPSDDPWQVAS